MPLTTDDQASGTLPNEPPRPPTTSLLADDLLALVGLEPSGRADVLRGMLETSRRERASYWLQLGVSIGIATLGLITGSAAVIIGAMLVAPLMGPIVGLAMGLASSSPLLVLRAIIRILVSVVLALGAAAMVTLMLPFHELNAELMARASPTVLDLVTAGFCAIAAVYASLRPSSDTSATAAGTAISISLVPPLCASGYGIGTGTWALAAGAALLFLTNLVAIVAVGTVIFWFLGFSRAWVADLEHAILTGDQVSPIVRALANRMVRVFESRRGGPVFRFLMPFLLLAAVFVPLSQALDEMAWEVNARASVRDLLERSPHRVVQSRVLVERHTIRITLVIMGRTADAEEVREWLDDELRTRTSTAPMIEVIALPTASSVAKIESSILQPAKDLVAAIPTEKPLSTRIDEAVETIEASVRRSWPDETGGTLLGTHFTLDESDGMLVVEILHQGAPLGPSGREILGKSVAQSLDRDVRIEERVLWLGVLDRSSGDFALLSQLSQQLTLAAATPMMTLCVERPPAESTMEVELVDTAAAAREAEFEAAVSVQLAAFPRVETAIADEWAFRLAVGACPPPPPRKLPPVELERVPENDADGDGTKGDVAPSDRESSSSDTDAKRTSSKTRTSARPKK